MPCLTRHPEAGIDPDNVEQTGASAKTEIPNDCLQEQDTPREEPAPEEWIAAESDEA